MLVELSWVGSDLRSVRTHELQRGAQPADGDEQHLQRPSAGRSVRVLKGRRRQPGYSGDESGRQLLSNAGRQLSVVVGRPRPSCRRRRRPLRQQRRRMGWLYAFTVVLMLFIVEVRTRVCSWLQSFCLPVILYGLEVTQPQKAVITILNNLINRAVYKIFKVSDKDVICHIRQYLGLYDIDVLCK